MIDILQCRFHCGIWSPQQEQFLYTSDYSHQPRVFIVITLLSHICSMKPCTKACTGPIISTDNLNKKELVYPLHINTTTNRYNSKLVFLSRNLSRCPQKLKATAYLSLVRPTLEYAASVWDPRLAKDIPLRQSSVKLQDLFMGITGGGLAPQIC